MLGRVNCQTTPKNQFASHKFNMRRCFVSSHHQDRCNTSPSFSACEPNSRTSSLQSRGCTALVIFLGSRTNLTTSSKTILFQPHGHSMKNPSSQFGQIFLTPHNSHTLSKIYMGAVPSFLPLPTVFSTRELSSFVSCAWEKAFTASTFARHMVFQRRNLMRSGEILLNIRESRTGKRF